MPQRSGTEKRQRARPYSVRFTDAEQARAKELADRAGVTVAALIRHSLFNAPLPRAARKSGADKVIGAFIGQLGKIGGNLNQLAKHYNAGHPMHDSLELTLRELRQLRTAIMEAAGREATKQEQAP